jgi:hypothetical protein
MHVGKNVLMAFAVASSFIYPSVARSESNDSYDTACREFSLMIIPAAATVGTIWALTITDNKRIVNIRNKNAPDAQQAIEAIQAKDQEDIGEMRKALLEMKKPFLKATDPPAISYEQAATNYVAKDIEKYLEQVATDYVASDIKKYLGQAATDNIAEEIKDRFIFAGDMFPDYPWYSMDPDNPRAGTYPIDSVFPDRKSQIFAATTSAIANNDYLVKFATPETKRMLEDPDCNPMIQPSVVTTTPQPDAAPILRYGTAYMVPHLLPQ